MKATLLLLIVSQIAFGHAHGLRAAESLSLPDAARQLQQKHNKAVAAAVAPLREQYLTELGNLYDEALHAKKPEDALAIQQEISAVTAQTMVGEWRNDRGIMKINSNGTLSHSNGTKGSWTIKDNTMILKWANGVLMSFPIARTGETLQGYYIGNRSDPALFRRLD